MSGLDVRFFAVTNGPQLDVVIVGEKLIIVKAKRIFFMICRICKNSYRSLWRSGLSAETRGSAARRLTIWLARAAWWLLACFLHCSIVRMSLGTRIASTKQARRDGDWHNSPSNCMFRNDKQVWIIAPMLDGWPTEILPWQYTLGGIFDEHRQTGHSNRYRH